MQEQDKSNPETAQQVGHRLLEFVEKTEFGTPQYQAVGDLLDLKVLEQSLKQEYKNVLSREDDRESSQYWGSRARITEHKIALLEHQISQHNSRVKGYQSAYVHFGIGLEELYSIANTEANGKFPEDTEQQRFYAENLYDRIFDKAQNSLNTKRE